MAGWHHGLDGRDSEWTPGVGDGQGGLACWDSWDRRVRHDWLSDWSERNRAKRLSGGQVRNLLYFEKYNKEKD